MQLRKRIPAGYHVVKSTGDGNCLFNSVSTAISGDESFGPALRILAVLHGIEHFQHYLQMVSVSLLHLFFVMRCYRNHVIVLQSILSIGSEIGVV